MAPETMVSLLAATLLGTGCGIPLGPACGRHHGRDEEHRR